MTQRIRLIHFNAGEAKQRAATLRAAGYAVSGEPPTPTTLRTLSRHPPAAVVIDLSRLPAQGRDLGLTLRHTKRTRHVPLVFVDGAPEKVRRVKEHLPDAVYTSWRRIRSAVAGAVARPPVNPVAPTSVFAGYSGTPLPKKLGVKENTVVALIGAPPDFEKTLGPLPDNVVFRRHARGRCDLVIWFTTSRRDLNRRIDKLGTLAGKGGLWIAWPKKAAGVDTDVTAPLVRGAGLATGLVDYKVCAVDDTWTALRFAKRKKK